jgi:nucleotide-binding universal stress UspA family protein
MIRVLVPTDFSKHALDAFTFGQQLFKGEKVTFTLYHAYEPSALQLLGNKSPLALSKIYRDLKDESEVRLSVFLSEILSKDKSTTFFYKTASYSGHLKDGIAALEENAYDYIVMGTKGATGLKEVFMGSMTHSIVALHKKVPLLVIPENAVFNDIDSIGFATDFARAYNHEDLQPLIVLTKLWKATVRMVEVYEKPEITQVKKDHLQQLEDLLSGVDYRFHTVPEFSSLENCINVFDDELNIDLLVMIDYPKTFFESLMREPVIKKMTFHTTLPFLILPSHN